MLKRDVTLYLSNFIGYVLERYLYFMLLHEQRSGIGIKLAKGCLKISYLMFADDRITFSRTSKKAARNMRYIWTGIAGFLDDWLTIISQKFNSLKALIQQSDRKSWKISK